MLNHELAKARQEDLLREAAKGHALAKLLPHVATRSTWRGMRWRTGVPLRSA